jgi:hypothetical protein
MASLGHRQIAPDCNSAEQSRNGAIELKVGENQNARETGFRPAQSLEHVVERFSRVLAIEQRGAQRSERV